MVAGSCMKCSIKAGSVAYVRYLTSNMSCIIVRSSFFGGALHYKTTYRVLCQMARPNSRAIRMMITHSKKLECWIRTSSESME